MDDDAPQPQDAKLVSRDPPQPEESRESLVKKRLDAIRKAEKHFENDFKRMREDMDLCRWGDTEEDEEKYRANITSRHVKQTVAALYAKNPRLTVRRKRRLSFKIWDGSPATLAAAVQAQHAATVAQAQQPDMPLPPDMMAAAAQAGALIEEVQRVKQEQQMLDAIAKTLQLVAEYYVNEQTPSFKKQMKQLVRRTVISGVGYLKIGWQRERGRSPEIEARLADARQSLAKMEQMGADQLDGETQPTDAEAEDLRLMVQNLEKQAAEGVILREGLVFEFPRATHVIPDIKTRQLDGWIGCDRLTEKFLLTPEEVQQTYGVDVGKSFTAYRGDGKAAQLDMGERKNDLVCVYEQYDRSTGLKYCMADGYPDFLREPYAPEVKVEGFFPIFALAFNTEEHEDKLFPLSDVRRLKPLQREKNRVKNALREHRVHARPRSVAASGSFEEKDKHEIENAPAHSVVEMQSLAPGEEIAKKVAAWPVAPLDPNLYNDQPIMADVMLVTGSAEANLGGTADATATEASIAETSRVSGMSSNGDDLNDFLTDVMRAAGQICLLEVQPETAMKIAGPGAVWPHLTREQITAEVELGIEAGSSGRPNRAQELANLERATPLLLQIPGVTPDWLAKRALNILDENIDLSEAFLSGMPSITAMNAAKQPGTGNPATDPNAQGGQGGDNAERPGERPEGGQPAYPVVDYDATGNRIAQPEMAGVAQ